MHDIYTSKPFKIARPDSLQSLMATAKTTDFICLRNQVNNSVGFFPNHIHVIIKYSNVFIRFCQILFFVLLN